MKQFILLLLIFLSAQFLFGQTSNDTLIPKKYIDSLKRKLSDEKNRNNILYWDYRLKCDVIKIDTLFIRSDSINISYFVKSNFGDSLILLKKMTILNYTKNEAPYYNGRFSDYIEYFYNDNQQIQLINYWAPVKGTSFDAKLSKRERLEYDNVGRVKLHITYIQSTGQTIKKKFWYDNLGKSYSTTTTTNGYTIWDE